jgi:hypothetical protein
MYLLGDLECHKIVHSVLLGFFKDSGNIIVGLIDICGVGSSDNGVVGVNDDNGAFSPKITPVLFDQLSNLNSIRNRLDFSHKDC